MVLPLLADPTAGASGREALRAATDQFCRRRQFWRWRPKIHHFTAGKGISGMPRQSVRGGVAKAGIEE